MCLLQAINIEWLDTHQYSVSTPSCLYVHHGYYTSEVIFISLKYLDVLFCKAHFIAHYTSSKVPPAYLL